MCCEMHIQRQAEQWNAMRCVIIVACLGLAACGGSGPDDGDVVDGMAVLTLQSQHEEPLLTNTPADIIATATSKAQAATWRGLLSSPRYSGWIVVQFAEDTDLTLDPTVREPQLFVSRTGKSVERVNGIRRALPDVPVRRLLSIDPEVWRAFRAQKQRDGVVLNDWASVYLFHVPDPVEAEVVLMGLYADPHVVWAHPEPVAVLLSSLKPPMDAGRYAAKGLTPPNITPGQDYLLNKPGHLNVVAAWDLGLTGKGQVVYDMEFNWNYAHADLPLNVTTTPFKGVPYDPYFAQDAEGIQHGTGVAGVIVGQANGFGILGMAPVAEFRTMPLDKSLDYAPVQQLESQLMEYVVGKVNGGRVLLVEFGIGQNAELTVAVPSEAYTVFFKEFVDLTTLGMVIVDAAGNAGLDLNDPNHVKLYKDVYCGPAGCPNLATDDSGALMVGSSEGANLKKKATSNCGNRVNVFAWGAGVVTTGYGDHPMSVPGDPNQWYTAQFGGTSAAAAEIAGIVLLLQEYVDQLYGPTLKPWEDVYLSAAQVRAVLTHPDASSPQSDGGCNIGKQPDVGKVLKLLKDGVITPTIAEKMGGKCKNGAAGLLPECPLPVTLAKPLDMNADGRADLIAWGREGSWYVDLSEGATSEGYGQWNLILTPPPLDAGRLFPVVHDYNTDGKVDLALYNTDTGKWRIKYTTDALFAGQFGNWDVVIDYSTQPQWQPSSWPAPGDYDGKADVAYQTAAGTYTTGKSIDLALVRPDGHWVFDLNLGLAKPFGDFEYDWQVLTDAQLAAAPGWAYLPAPYDNGIGTLSIAFKSPDTVPNGERLYKSTKVFGVFTTDLYIFPPIFGSNATVLVPGKMLDDASPTMGLRQGSLWPFVDLMFKVVEQPPLMEGFGGIACRAVTGDFDGDQIDDRAVLCPNGEWKIAYTSTKFVPKTTVLQYVKNGTPFQAVPGHVYPGGVSFQEVNDIYGAYNYGCAKSPCTIQNLPSPIGPYFAECLKLWANHPLSCLSF